MKKIITISFLVQYAMLTFAQSPKTISYQAILRDNIGVLISNDADVSVRVSLIQGNLIDNNVIYSEHHDVATNANGLFTIEIGGGTIESGNYTNINWGLGPFYLKTEIDPNGATNYLITAISELLSVPLSNYAFEAGKLSGPAGNFVGWYNQTAQGIAIWGELFLGTGAFALTYLSSNRLLFQIQSTSSACETYPAVVNPSNTNEINVTWQDGLILTFTLNENILTYNTGGQGVDFNKE